MSVAIRSGSAGGPVFSGQMGEDEGEYEQDRDEQYAEARDLVGIGADEVAHVARGLKPGGFAEGKVPAENIVQQE